MDQIQILEREYITFKVHVYKHWTICICEAIKMQKRVKMQGCEKNYLSQFLDDFEVQYLALSEESRRTLENQKQIRWSLSWRYFADFVLCQTLFGTLLISVWRGIWDFTYYILEDKFGVKKLLNRINYYCTTKSIRNDIFNENLFVNSFAFFKH